VYTETGSYPNYTYSPSTETVTGLIYIYAATEDDTDESPKITDVINSPTTVTLTDGKLNVSLGTPKNTALINLAAMFSGSSGITVSQSDAKIFLFYGFSTTSNSSSDTKTIYQLAKDYNDIGVFYFYSDKDVNITGRQTQTDEYGTYTSIYAMNLKTGWNSVITTSTETISGYNSIYRTEKPSADYKWVLSVADW
jgi:hypothetical protein